MRRLVKYLIPALLCAQTGLAAPQHGISMYGEPNLPPNYTHLPYANLGAPKGGSIVYGEISSFDSMNPFIQKGQAPYGVKIHVFESLLGRSYDEPFALYGLLAESVETGPNREWVEFTLREEARFSDGDPVTVEDVIWSFETMATEGKLTYARSWAKVDKVEQTGPRSVRFTLSGDDREFALILGLRQILNKSDFDGVDFAESSLRVPVGSGPYVIGEFEPGRFISFQRNPDYWGKDLPFNRGRHNLDEIRYEYFGNAESRWQAFTAGEVSVNIEWSAAKWADQYGFPAVEDGRIIKTEFAHQRPTGMQGFVFNTRRAVFSDIRVRDALLHAFDFEWFNKTFNKNEPKRIQSFFSNSPLGFTGAAEGRELTLLEPFKDEIAPDALTDYRLPVTDGTGRDRGNARKVRALLADAGWTDADGTMRNADGTPLEFEILLRSTANEAVAGAYAQMLQRFGITANVRLVDAAQYNERRRDYDYDMVLNTWGMSLSPGNEQYAYWGRNTVTEPGSRNYPGVDSAAVEAMIAAMLNARSSEDMLAAIHALDRVLTTGRYVIPFDYLPYNMVAHDARLKYPEQMPLYGFWLGFLPDVWWFEE